MKFSTPNSRIAAFVVAAVLLVAVTWLVAYRVVVQDYEERLARGEDRARELAGFFERDTRKILTVADIYVREALRVYQEEGGIEGVRAFVEKATPENDLISHVTVIGADGVPMIVTGHTIRSGSSAADRPYFLYHQDNEDGGTYISLPHEGRNTGRLTVRLVRRISAPDGSFGGVIFAAIHADQFTAFYQTLNLGPKSSATLVGLDKRIRARSSYGRLGPGQDISKSRLWKELAQRDIGLYRQNSVVDNITRMYAYRKMSDYPLLVAMGLSEDDVVVGAAAYARPVYAIAGLTTMVILVLTAMLCRDVYVRYRLETEVSERRVAETKLETANTDLLQYAYSASHDLKGPLLSISGLLEYCIEDLDNREFAELRDNLGEARSISQRSAKKVESLLRIARVGNDDLKTEPFVFQDLVNEIWSDLTAGADADCRLELDLNHQEPMTADKTIVHVVIENLISNALKYRDTEKDHALVRVGTRIKNGSLLVSVTDNGTGISLENREAVFEAFKRFDDRGGDGLGLALVRKHVDRIGGSIALNSEIGHGTTFEVMLGDHR